MKSSARVFFSFLTGVATGTLIGILFAPDTGKNTRDRLSYRLDKYVIKLKELLGKEVQAPGTSVPDRISDMSKQDYQKAADLLREVENLLDDMKNKPTD